MIERDELLKMGRDARSWQYQDQRGDLEEGTFCFDEDSLQVFANAILERAALECDRQSEEYGGQDYYAIGCYEAAAAVRALKTKE